MARLLALTTLALLAAAAKAHEPWKGAFECQAGASTGAAPADNGLCACAAGWAGPDCRVCTEDAACVTVLKSAGATCAKTSFTAVDRADGWCAVSSKEVTDLLHGSAYVQMQYEKTGEFAFHFVKKHDDTGKFVPIFRCQSDKTTANLNHGTGMVTYTSPDLQCDLTCELGADRSCSKALSGIVKMVGAGNGSTIVCDPFAKSCDVHEATLDAFLNGGVKTTDCVISECVKGAAKPKGGKTVNLRRYD